MRYAYPAYETKFITQAEAPACGDIYPPSRTGHVAQSAGFPQTSAYRQPQPKNDGDV